MKLCCDSETPTPFALSGIRKGIFAGPKNTGTGLSFEERSQLQGIQVFCSLHNGVAQPKTHGLGAEEVMVRKAKLAERLRAVNGLQAEEPVEGQVRSRM